MISGLDRFCSISYKWLLLCGEKKSEMLGKSVCFLFTIILNLLSVFYGVFSRRWTDFLSLVLIFHLFNNFGIKSRLCWRCHDPMHVELIPSSSSSLAKIVAIVNDVLGYIKSPSTLTLVITSFIGDRDVWSFLCD